MRVSFNGFQENATSFLVSGTVKKGDLVKVSENGTVTACTDGDKFCGIALSVRAGIAVVQLSGYVRVPYSDSMTPGYQTLAAGSGSTVKTSETGRELLVLDVDSTNTQCGILL